MYLNTSRKGMKYLVDRSDQHPMLAKLPLDLALKAWRATNNAGRKALREQMKQVASTKVSTLR
jgi:hypothetical protein